MSNSTTTMNDGKNVGILGMEVYFPSTYILQSELEQHTGVAAGKYTIGLGQEGLAVVSGDAEDVNSLALTVVHSLLEKYDIDPMQVGRLEVGTETLVDKSKSTKTVLMSLFKGNTDIEGATVVNACYGGTAALLNACAWVESDSVWDGRYAIVVATDIAAYARGPARPTCGAGAVAMLIGRDAPLVLAERATHCAHVWDFFKPDPSVEYPTVDGALSQVCYYQALEDVYSRLASKVERSTSKPFTAETPDYFCFHAPYNKLVQKSYGRLYFMDAKREADKHANATTNGDNGADMNGSSSDDPLAPYVSKAVEETYGDKALEKVLKGLSSASFKKRLGDSNIASQKIGNTYTASVFMGIASLVDRVGGRGELTAGKSVCVFSYGSGALATMYRLNVRDPSESQFTVAKMAEAMKLTERIEQRELIKPEELDYALETRAKMHHSRAPYSPLYPTVGRMFPGTYYLTAIDAQWRRHYARVPLDGAVEKDANGALAPPLVLRQIKQDAISTPVTGKLRAMSEEMVVPQRIACVVTGTAAGLPGQENVFAPGNLESLLEGRQRIGPIPDSDKQHMLEKKVVQVKKNKDGTTEKVPVDSEEKLIKLASQLGSVDLTSAYCVPRGLAETMDVAAQVAVAAGMEALKDAGLVQGGSTPESWRIPERYRDTTGIVYCSSFPAMDAAVGEVMRFLESKTVGAADSMRLISALRSRMIKVLGEDNKLSDEDEAAFARLLSRATEMGADEEASRHAYVFDRKFLFRVLVLGNAQLAQLAGARGPNTQTNAACAGTTQAIAMAQDMLISGRAERVVVVAGDNASGSILLPWLGSGFRALGAASTAGEVESAACPFDKRRSGLLLGAGAIGIVIETEESCNARQVAPENSFTVKARLLATQYSNSGFHGAALDRKHIGSELIRFLNDVELIHGISKAEIASHGVYFSHETGTHATSASSCAGNEIAALRMAFGDSLLSKMRLLNTKGFTGHPMGVSFEDVTAVEVLLKQRVPPLPNYKEKDDYLGDLNISTVGGPYACRYALRFAAGFGSQVAFALYATAQFE